MVIPCLCLILLWVQLSDAPDCQELLAGAAISPDWTLEQPSFHRVQQPCLCSLFSSPKLLKWAPEAVESQLQFRRALDSAASAAPRQGEKVQDECKASSQPTLPSPSPCQTAQAASKHLSAPALRYCFSVSIYQGLNSLSNKSGPILLSPFQKFYLYFFPKEIYLHYLMSQHSGFSHWMTICTCAGTCWIMLSL